MSKGPRCKLMGRFVTIAGRATSVSLEDAFWQSPKEIASERDMTRSELVAKIDSKRQEGNLSTAIRLRARLLSPANSSPQAPP